MVRAPDLISTHSACRGELFRRSRPKSLITSARSKCVTKTRAIANAIRLIGMKMSILGRRRARRARPTFQHRIDAPATSAVEKHEEKKPAIKYGELTLIGDWEKTVRRMHHEVSHSHCAAGDERGEPRDQAERDQKSADQANPAAQLQDRFIRAWHAAEHAEKQLAAVTGEVQTKNKPCNTINRVTESIE